MSIFGTNQVEEVIIGNAVATEGTVSAFKADASEKEIKALAADGGTASLGKLFYLLQKTGGEAAKYLDFEFTDKINPKKIEKITLAEYAPEVQKSVNVTGFAGAEQANTTYAVSIRLYNESGALSTENFRVISGYFNSGSTEPTADEIRDGIVQTLNAELVSRGDDEFEITTSADTITITGKYQKVVPGKITGRQIEFDVTTKAIVEAGGENLGLLDVEVTQHNYPGAGTSKLVINREWFVKGFKYEPYREMSYPNNFDTPYYADKAGIYNTVVIAYKSDRISPGVEEQHKTLIVYVEKPTDDAAGNAPTNALLADLRTFIGDYAEVPADLAVA